MTRNDFLAAVAERKGQVDALLLDDAYHNKFLPEHLQRGIYSYIKNGGKRLRPAVLMFCCGAVGGDERLAVPAAAAVEVFHTWTLVHDDLIDNDSTRRGHPTVHEEARQWAEHELGYSSKAAYDYGRDVCILSGDVQQGWAVSLLLQGARRGLFSAELALELTHTLEFDVLPQLIAGEVLDVQFSRRKVETLNEDDVLNMLWLKTAVLYQFAGMAGACIGEDRVPDQAKKAVLLGNFTGKCGIAFQLQDDILGVTGEEAVLGKPVGSDIREGKRTLILLHAVQHANAAQSDFLFRVLGNRGATDADIQKVRQMLIDLGSIGYTANLARQYLQEALAELDFIPDSSCKELLKAWADFMVRRDY